MYKKKKESRETRRRLFFPHVWPRITCPHAARRCSGAKERCLLPVHSFRMPLTLPSPLFSPLPYNCPLPSPSHSHSSLLSPFPSFQFLPFFHSFTLDPPSSLFISSLHAFFLSPNRFFSFYLSFLYPSSRFPTVFLLFYAFIYSYIHSFFLTSSSDPLPPHVPPSIHAFPP